MTSLESEFIRHASFLRALARRVAVDSAAADDLVQETYVAALKSRGDAPRNPRAWLATVLKRRASNQMRSDRHRFDREVETATAGKAVDPADTAMEIEVARRLLGHVEGLSESYRSIVFLRYYEGLKPKEIAARVGEPVGTVKTRLARALEMLRLRLDSDDPKGREAWLSAMVAIGRAESVAARAAGGALGGAGLWASLAAFVALVGLALGAYVRSDAGEAVDSEVPSVELAAGELTSDTDAPSEASELLTAGASSVNQRAALETAAVEEETQTLSSRVVNAPFGSVNGEGRPAAGVTVKVTVKEAQLPKASAGLGEVNLTTLTDFALAMGRSVELVTGADGSFSLTIPNDAEVTSILVMSSGDFRPATWKGTKADWPAVLTRTKKSSVAGRVVDLDGNPVGSVLVRARMTTGRDPSYVDTQSDEHGRFSVDHASDSLGVIGVRDGWIHLGARWIDDARGDARRAAEVVMTPAGTLDLKVVGPSGEAVTDFPLFVWVRAGEPCTALRGYQILKSSVLKLDADAWVDGRASLSVPSGVALTCANRRLTISDQKDGFAVCTGRVDDSAQPIIVPPGEHYQLTVQLAVYRTLQVRTVDTEGRPVARCELEVELREEEPGQMPFRPGFTSDQPGEFSVPIASTEESVTLRIQAKGSEADAPYGALIAMTQQQFSQADERPLIMQLAPKSLQPNTVSLLDPRPSAKGATRIEFVSDEGLEDVSTLDVHVGRFVSNPSDPTVASDMANSALEFARGPGTWFDLLRRDHPEGQLRIEKRSIQVTDGKAEIWVSPGIAWLGVQPCSASGAKMQRMSVGLVEIEPGSWTLSVRPNPLTPFSARITLKGAPRKKLYAALVDSTGRHLYGSPIASWKTVETARFPIGTRGDFGVMQVPVGL